MKILDAKKKIELILNTKFSDIVSEFDQINKGDAGQILERYLNINSGNRTLDFEDGELKTFKCQLSNKKLLPMETMAVTTISKNNIDSYLNSNYEATPFYKKMSLVLIVPVVKRSDGEDLHPTDWFIPLTFLLSKDNNSDLYTCLQKDFKRIIEQIKEHDVLHTYNGYNDYLQIRSKDSKDKYGNYHAVVSPTTNIQYSNKNYAFYIKKSFLRDILKQAL